MIMISLKKTKINSIWKEMFIIIYKDLAKKKKKNQIWDKTLQIRKRTTRISAMYPRFQI